MTDQDQKAIALNIAKTCYANPVQFCHYFLPHWFGGTDPADIMPGEEYTLPNAMPWLHMGMLSALTKRTQFLWEYGDAIVRKIETNFVFPEDPNSPEDNLISLFEVDWDSRVITLKPYPFLLFMVPRGFSKTTLFNAANLYGIYYLELKFPVYTSESGPHSAQQLTNIKTEIEINERLRTVFGQIQPKQREGKWSESHAETTTGIHMMALGRGSQIRGKNVRAKRPDRIILDDVEDEESVNTDEQRDKTRKWFYAAVQPALQVGGGGEILAAGTLLHDDAILQTFRRDPAFACIVFGAHDRQGDLLWAWHMDEKRLEASKRSYQIAGKLNIFYMEYYNTLRNDDTSKFKQENFIYFPAPENMQTAIALDPAISTSKKASEASMCVWGMSENGLLFKLDEYAKVGMSVRDMIDNYFRLSVLYDCRYHGIESQAFQASLIHVMKEEMFRKKTKYFEIIPITHANNQTKEQRIAAILQPRYAAGYVRHVRRFPESETQLLDFPNGKLDRVDADSMAVSLLDPHAASAAGDDYDLSEDEFEDEIDEAYRHAP